MLEMSLINCEINLTLTRCENSIISKAAVNQPTTFPITNTKRYVSVVTLSTNNNGKLLQLKLLQLISGFKRKVNWNKYSSKTTTQNALNRYLDYLIDSSFSE